MSVPLNLKYPIDLNQIPRKLPGNAYYFINEELILGNQLLSLENQSGMPDETVYVAEFLYSFRGKHTPVKFKLEYYSVNTHDGCLVCTDNEGCVVIYAGKVASKGTLNEQCITYKDN